MNLDHARSAMVLSFSFMELGQQAISDGSGWLTPVVLRESIIAKATNSELLCFHYRAPRQNKRRCLRCSGSAAPRK